MEDFDGKTYDAARDQKRLSTNLHRVKLELLDGKWHTIPQLARVTNGSEAGVSARLRDLRKDKFGGYVIDRAYVSQGLWEYRLAGKKDKS